MKNLLFSITLIASLLLIFINSWVTIALGFILAGMRLMVQLVLRNHIKPDHIDLFVPNKGVFGTLSKIVLWDGLQFDQTKVLITAIKKGDFFNAVLALYAGADAELGMMANIASVVPNQETLKTVLIRFGAELIDGADATSIFVDELELDNYYPIRDISMNELEAKGVIDPENRPIKLDQIKGVVLAVERFGVRKIENTETTLSQSKVDVKTEEEIEKDIRSFLSRFSMHETIRDEQMTFYSKSQRVPCINPLCRYGKVICTECEGNKTQVCTYCNGSGVLDHNGEIQESVQEVNQCPDCQGTGTEPGTVIEIDCEHEEMEECKVCLGKGTIKQDYCHNCEGSGRVCALCGGTGVREIIEKGPVCKTCGGMGVIATQITRLDHSSTQCKKCDGTGSTTCNTCLGKGTIDCESCEGNGHMFRIVKLKVVLDAFPAGDHASFVQFDQDDMNQLFVSDHEKIISNMRQIEDVKVYRHEDRMVGKLFHNPDNPILIGVNKFLGEIEAPFNQAYERVELIVATYHYITFTDTDGIKNSILLLNDNKYLS